MNKILILGASIAGLSTAYWLSQQGFQVTLVELNTELRRGGLVIGIKELGQKIISMMGINDRINDRRIEMSTTTFYGSKGERMYLDQLKTIEKTQLKKDDVFLLRGDLIDIIADVTLSQSSVNIRYDDSIERITPYSSGVIVKFLSGVEENYWAVIGADGIKSRVRQLCFKQIQMDSIVDQYRVCICSIPNILELTDSSVICFPNNKTKISIMPIRQNQELF